MMNDPAFADYADGMEAPMPDWIDGDFIKAVVAVGKELPGRDHGKFLRRRKISTLLKKIDGALEQLRKR
jgi:hypothetical protein